LNAWFGRKQGWMNKARRTLWLGFCFLPRSGLSNKLKRKSYSTGNCFYTIVKRLNQFLIGSFLFDTSDSIS
jgi:hypothetical protein